jgi:hypothetical protein
MKRLIFALGSLFLCLPLFAQYDFATEFERQMVISTASPKFHNYYISIQNAPRPSDGGSVYYIYSQTSSHADASRFQFHLGSSVEEALQTIETLRNMLDQPVGTTDTLQNYNIRSEVKVVASKRKRQGNVLRIHNNGQTGVVYLTRPTLDIMADAMRYWDPVAGTSFAKKQLSDKAAIQAEINLYANRLSSTKSTPTDYAPSYKKLFKQRIREYKRDLQQ